MTIVIDDLEQVKAEKLAIRLRYYAFRRSISDRCLLPVTVRRFWMDGTALNAYRIGLGMRKKILGVIFTAQKQLATMKFD